jgi:uncharacterized membrane protein
MNKTVADLSHRWFTKQPENLTAAQSEVLQSAINRRTITRDTSDIHQSSMSAGDRLADAIARVGGSWGFIISFLTFLVVWTLGNVYLLATHAFDPYPFIFLNLVLSMIAALQAPIIMMSQNRQAARDRIEAGHDYEVNLKSEIEIMALHEKLDEVRHQDIIAMRQDITAIHAALERIESRLANAGPAA